jgi:hypothetical protein
METFIIIGLVAALFWYAYTQGGASGGMAGPMSSDPFVNALANAIATAENANPSINNPGDLTAGDVNTDNITGVFNSAGVVIVSDIQTGWNALTAKLERILAGNSQNYSPDMTISDLANTYTGNQNAEGWADTVSSQLGVTPDTTLADAQAQYDGGDNG